MKTKLIFVICILLLISGCAAPAEQIVTIAAENTPAPAVTPVQSVIPTIEITPIITPAITEEPMQTAKSTPKPKATPAATPTAEPALQPTSKPTEEPTPQPTAEPAADADSSDFGGSILSLVNSHRNAAGTASLKYASSLQKAADIRARECLDSFSHTRPNGSDAHTVLAEHGLGFTSFGENLFKATGMGDVSAEFVVEQWMESPGHRQNIVQEMFTHMCIGVASKGDELYVVQLFGAGLS